MAVIPEMSQDGFISTNRRWPREAPEKLAKESDAMIGDDLWEGIKVVFSTEKMN